MSLSNRFVSVVIAATLVLSHSAFGAGRDSDKREFDARDSLNAGLKVKASPSQDAAISAMRLSVPELAATINQATGVTRTLTNRVGYLSAKQAGAPEAVAMNFAQSNLALLGLSAADLADYETSASVYSAPTGATHIYLNQRAHGLSLFNGQLHMNINRDGQVLSINNSFLPGLAAAVNTTTPALSASDAVLIAAKHIEIAAPGKVVINKSAGGAERATTLSAPGVSRKPIDAKLMLLPISAGDARLVWHFWVFTHDSQHVYIFNVDAVDGKIWTLYDAVDSAQYKVYAQPEESPTHTSPLPPADGRTIEVDPADATASPFGWHDENGVPGAEFTIMRGNNVRAYEDRDGNNNPPASQPNCGAMLNCDFPIDLTVDPINHIPASVTNLFYWNNIIHDVQYQYGFDETAGNFQANNYGRGGISALDGDYVEAEAQDDANDNSDAGGNCNANFLTLPDGVPGTMQMYTCDLANPERDGDLDNGVIIHEYGHGISNRLVGGPANTFCLEGDQQPGEGLSDWWALAYTHEVGDTGPDARGIGTYLFGQAPTGPGIRSFPYSTDNSINPDTYESVDGRVAPHGVGSVWAQGAWEVYWALVDKHGFNPNLYNAMGGSGNQRAMLYVNEGLKNTMCQPTFADVRDGIIQAAVDNYGGEDVCTIWRAFAEFGLGSDAVAGTPATTKVVNGFSVPRSCQADFTMAVTPPVAKVCSPTNAGYSIDLGINPLGDPPVSSTTVTLTVAGTPPGSTAVFSPNPNTVNIIPVMSTLTIGTASATPGDYTLTITGDDGGTFTATKNVDLSVYTAEPTLTAVSNPADSATDVSIAPTFTWVDPGQSDTYEIDLATDAGFGTIIGSATVSAPTHFFNFLLDELTTYHWRVRTLNSCGQSPYTVASFTTGLRGGILLVDDDDNDPDARAAYTSTLSALGLPYDVWDTANSDNEPNATQMGVYSAVVWFTGDEFGGFAGPDAASEAALTTYLDGGGCFLLSSQDYFYDRGQTNFMLTHLGLVTAMSDVSQTEVTAAGSVFGGLGIYNLNYPFSNYSDDLAPSLGVAEFAFNGDATGAGGAAINKTDGTKSAFFGYPIEAMSPAGREATLSAFIVGQCALPDIDEDGVLDIADNCIDTPNSTQADDDADGVGDACDNCGERANPDQCDTNLDGFGNACDADLDNNGTVNSFDLTIMRSNFGAMGSNDADLDCNNSVNSFDLSIMRDDFGKSPGPSCTGGTNRLLDCGFE